MKEFGLIGETLSHSYSKSYFTEKFKNHGIDATYELFELENIEQIEELIRSRPNLAGFNVTIPYKQQIIPYCHKLEKTAMISGAVNAVKIIRKNASFLLEGYNTDIKGFSTIIESALFLSKAPTKALILGTGGASRAVQFALRSHGIGFTLVSRKISKDSQVNYSMLTADDLKHYPLIINTTPLGMFPDIHSKPRIRYAGIGAEHVLIDLIYNPAETAFLEEGKKRGATVFNGMQMFTEQAEQAWKIWQE